MPLKSKAQMRWMAANDPEMLSRWAAHTKSVKKLPERVRKTMPETEFAPIAQHKIVQRKKKQKHLSEASAALGLTALAAKAPAGAAAITRKFPKYTKPLKRVAEMAPKADKLSENIVPASLGVGALGSINFARLQGQEAKATTPVKKSLGSLTQHVSPAAENAYNDLGARRRRRNSDAAVYGGGAALAGGTAARALTVKMPQTESKIARRAARATIAAPLAAVAGGLGYGAVRRAQEGAALQERRAKIKAKGQERQAAGQYGRGRPKPKLSEMSKAFGVPSGIKPGGLMRTATGKTVTRRGTIPGTGKFVPTIRRAL